MVVKFDINLHQRILNSLLIEILKGLDEKIAFKGGTCAALFYNLNRFSFDLDFDILEDLTSEEIDMVREALAKHGTIRDFYEKRYSIFFLLDYGKYYPNIKIEFNKRVWENNNYKMIWFLGIRMKIVDEATIFTNKLVALTTRRETVGRDLFDAYYFLKQRFPINENLIRERTDKSLKDYLQFLISFIKKNYTERNILQGLGEVLNPQQKEWAKKNLIPETVKEIKSLI